MGLGLLLTTINVSWLSIWIHARYRPDAESDEGVITKMMLMCFVNASMLFLTFGVMLGFVMADTMSVLRERHGWPPAQLRPLYGATPTTPRGGGG